MYNMRITTKNAKSTDVISSFELARPFTEWFNEAGFFVPAPFQELLASNVPVVGKADPKRVKSASQKMFDENPELLDAVLASQGDATGTDAKSGGKRRKA
jgi:signal peptidase complex subunit 2